MVRVFRQCPRAVVLENRPLFFLGSFRGPQNVPLCRKGLPHVALWRLVEARGPQRTIPLSPLAHRRSQTQRVGLWRDRASVVVRRPSVCHSVPKALTKGRGSNISATGSVKRTGAFRRRQRFAEEWPTGNQCLLRARRCPRTEESYGDSFLHANHPVARPSALPAWRAGRDV